MPSTPTKNPRARWAARLALTGASAAAALGVTAPASAAPGIKAGFRAGILTVDGTSAGDTITVTRTITGRLLVNGGAVPISGATPTVANTDLVSIDGRSGPDRITLDGATTDLPRAELIGGKGADTLTGGPRSDLVAGGEGADVILGGTGKDDLQAGPQDDTIGWSAGDGGDDIDGGDGADVLIATGAVGDIRPEEFLLSGVGTPSNLLLRTSVGVGEAVVLGDVERHALATRGGEDHVIIRGLRDEMARRVDLDLSGDPATGQPDGAPDTVTIDGSTVTDTIRVRSAGPGLAPTPAGLDLRIAGGGDATDALAISAKQGDDVVDLTGLAAGQVAPSIHGDDDADRITGSAGADEVVGDQGEDVIDSGDGADRISGSDGRDTIRTGTGDDLVSWSSGDDGDRIDDSAGRDRLQLQGTNAAEAVGVVRAGARVEVDSAGSTFDTAGLDEVGFVALAGADSVIVGDLEGTSIDEVEVDLQDPDRPGDTAVDTIVHNGTSGDDSQLLTEKPDRGYTLTGTGATVAVVGSEPATDVIIARGHGGDDSLRATGTIPAKVVLEGGEGADELLGNASNDTLRGGAGDDLIEVVGTSGTDTVEGGTGADRFIARGTGGVERFVVAAQSGRTRITRDQGGGSLLADVEQVEIAPGRGRDTVRIESLKGTPTTTVRAALEGVPGAAAGDREADQVEIVATGGADVVSLIAAPGQAALAGLAARVELVGLDPEDRLTAALGAGPDQIDGGSVAAGRLLAVFDLGAGDDRAIGTRGDDTILGGAGRDTIDASLGRDTVDGGSGTDKVTNAEVITNVP